jgi:hypothetical protein
MRVEAGHEMRLARILGVPLAEDAVRQWPQSDEAIGAASFGARRRVIRRPTLPWCWASPRRLDRRNQAFIAG